MTSANIAPLPQVLLSGVLATIFRGKLCEVILRDRRITTFAKDEVLYDIGDKSRVLFFIRGGFVKVETLTEDGHELIYDVRKAGDVVGELCASGQPRPDRAVALEPAAIVKVPFDDVLESIRQDRSLLREFVQIFCGSLSNAYEQLNSVAFSGTIHRLVKVLVRLGKELGRPSPHGTELSARLTQEELAQMVAVRRERLSTAMNVLRSRGLIDYTRGGHIVLDLAGLESHADGNPAPARAQDNGTHMRIGQSDA